MSRGKLFNTRFLASAFSILSLFLTVVLLAGVAFVAPAQADLARVGPANTPAPPGHGFPFWYQDLNGLVLDICLPNASDTGALQQTACLLGPPDPPYVFPNNFPDEVFYFRAVSTPIDTGGGKRAILVLALEAAFANGGPVPGDQMVFTRIRVTAGVPFDGDYTVTHPYGTESFPGVTAGVGNRDIVFSEDIGITAGAFTEALHSRVGPFLQASASPGGPANAPVNLNGALFLSDGVAPEFLTGSPFGTDWFELCGPFDGPGTNRCIRENTFTLTGRLHNFVTNPIGSPLSIDRATYARNAAGDQAQVDVLASASAGIGQAAPKLTAAAPNMSPVLMSGPTVLGEFYAQGIPVPAETIPSLITVTNSGDVPPTSATLHIVDEVTIPQASYNPATPGTLTVVATSSDKLAPVPTLAIDGFPGAQVSSSNNGDPASMTFTVFNVPIPPSAITVVSSRGGQGFAAVTMGAALAFPCGVPFTQDDSGLATQGGPAIVIPVRDNDTSCLTFNNQVILAPGPNIGTAVVNGDGTISFTPPGSTGTATFQYTVANLEGTSNVATVTVDIGPAAGGPVPTANNDGPFTVFTGQSTVLDVLANDTANGGALDPATVTITSAPASGTATANANGTITYTAGATTGTFTFAYTVKNTNGNVSPPATVSVTVTNPQQVTISLAQFKGGAIREWRVQGTTSPVIAGTVITVTLVRSGTTVGTVASTAADAAGAWRINLKGAGLQPVAQQGDIVRATSSVPGSIAGTLPVTVR